MKKLIAILLSALMLCTMIPFATVSAADEPTIVVSTDAEEYNAGDEIEVTVELQNNPGVIAATVEILYDHDALELVTYYDEDEEMYLPQIEVGATFNASSNKYITFGPIDDETGVAKKCVVSYIRGTAKSNCEKELFFTATFKVKDDAVSGNYDLTISYDPANFFNVDMVDVAFGKQDTSIVINGSEPGCDHEYFTPCDQYCMLCGELTNPDAAHNVQHVAAKAATCTDNGNIEYWYCDVCGQAWLDAECIMNTNLRSVILPATGHSYFDDCSAICDVCGAEREVSHNVIHVDAVAATCTTDGNIEYWYCDVCGAAWLDEACTLNTNLRSVILPASCSYGAVYTPAKAATCFEPGNTEYWYCANCDVYYADAACAIVTNAKNVIIPITHNIIHVDAVAPTCTTDGNIEYWYCADCGSAWLDELCHMNTNLKSVILPASCSYSAVYTPAKAATCFEPGNTEYWYCANCDVYYADAACAIVTNAKNVIIPITHNIIHVEAVAATCSENGNIEYWYCADCGAAWLDELCHMPTNLKSVILPASCSYGAQYFEAKAATCFEPGNTEYWYCANCDVYYADAACAIVTNAKNVIIPITHNIIYVEAKAATCTEMGNIEHWYCADCGQAWLDELCIYNTNLKAVVLPAAGHTYTNAHDADCNVCGETREIVLPADEIVLFGGSSVSEQRNGLAFKFDAAVSGLTADEECVADYANGTVTINGVEYKLIGMGAIANNQGLNNLELDAVDGVKILDIPAEKIFNVEADSACFAIRIINIPAAHLDTVIIARPYYVYENAEGAQITVYGEDVADTYNNVLNG